MMPSSMYVLTLYAMDLSKSWGPWAATGQHDHHHSTVLCKESASSVNLSVQSRDDIWIWNEIRAAFLLPRGVDAN